MTNTDTKNPDAGRQAALSALTDTRNRIFYYMTRNAGEANDGAYELLGETKEDLTAVIKQLEFLAFSQPDNQFVPGVMHCAKCKFQLVRNIMYMQSGTIGAGDNKTEPCPNGCGPLWPVTWKQQATELMEMCEKQHHEIQALKEAKPPEQGQTDNAEYLLRGLCEIREIYCNMEGFIPETAPEGYVLQEIRKMYETAVEFIKGYSELVKK